MRTGRGRKATLVGHKNENQLSHMQIKKKKKIHISGSISPNSVKTIADFLPTAIGNL